MKFYVFALMLLSAPCLAAGERVYMLGKIKLQDTTHVKLVFFYDKGITTISDCQREVYRGSRGQWRYHHHKFVVPKGFAQRVDYYCVTSPLTAGPWSSNARYDKIYKVDMRQQKLKIKPEKSYVSCLNHLRREVREESSKFFCAKLSQSVSF